MALFTSLGRDQSWLWYSSTACTPQVNMVHQGEEQENHIKQGSSCRDQNLPFWVDLFVRVALKKVQLLSIKRIYMIYLNQMAFGRVVWTKK